MLLEYRLAVSNGRPSHVAGIPFRIPECHSVVCLSDPPGGQLRAGAGHRDPHG